MECYKERSGINLVKEYGISNKTIYKLVRERNVSIKNIELIKSQIKEIAIRYQSGETGPRLSQEYGVSNWTIYKLLRRMKISIKRCSKLNDKQSKEVAEEYNGGKSALNLAKKYSISSATIYSILKRKNIPIRSYSQVNRIYLLDENYFEKIDRKDKAYWFGFCFADGYLYKKKSLNITLGAKDKSFLNKFKNVLNTSIPIKYIEKNKGGYNSTNGRVRFRVFCKKMCEDLIANGYLQKYNYIPKSFPEYLLNHFIRGFFDGDGSISVRSRNNCKRQILDISLCGTEAFLTELKKKLPFKCNNKIIKKKGTSLITMGDSTAIKFLKWIYKNTDSSIRMKRKYEKFNNFLNKHYIIKKHIKLADNQTKEILKRYKGGDSGIILAKQYGVDKTTIYRLLKKRNVLIRNKMKLTKKQGEEISIRYQTGESGTKIAKKYNVHPSTIYRLLRNMSVSIK